MRKTTECSPATEPPRSADDYRLLPGAIAEFFCNPCDRPHLAKFDDGLFIEVYFTECVWCHEDTAELVDVVKEGSLP